MDYFQWLFIRWQGRVNRKLYWVSIAFLCLLPVIPHLFSLLLGFKLWESWYDFYFLCTAGPLISLIVKRLHDTERTFLWLLKIIPVIGLSLIYLSRLQACPKVIRTSLEDAGPDELAKYVGFTGLTIMIFLAILLMAMVVPEFDLQKGIGAGLFLMAVIPSTWMLIVLLAIPGTVGENRYGPDPIVKEIKHPALKKIEIAIDMIEPWVDKKFPFALSLQTQLEWCQLMLSGLGVEEPKGELTMVRVAEQVFDEWMEKAYLVQLLKEIELATEHFFDEKAPSAPV